MTINKLLYYLVCVGFIIGIISLIYCCCKDNNVKVYDGTFNDYIIVSNVKHNIHIVKLIKL